MPLFRRQKSRLLPNTLGSANKAGSRYLKIPHKLTISISIICGIGKSMIVAALDPREPLYHSDPFFFEFNGVPEYNTVCRYLYR